MMLSVLKDANRLCDSGDLAGNGTGRSICVLICRTAVLSSSMLFERERCKEEKSRI